MPGTPGMMPGAERMRGLPEDTSVGMMQMLGGMQQMMAGMQAMLRHMDQMHRMAMMGAEGRPGPGGPMAMGPPGGPSGGPPGGPPGAPGTAESGAAAAYMMAMRKMMHDMRMSFTGDADHDFVVAMIPHHEGAIDMAKIELEHGQDPELRRLAQAIVESQQREIEAMQDWLRDHKP
jgi:hypothetical protein